MSVKLRGITPAALGSEWADLTNTNYVDLESH